jgi:poly-gamma-glutamate capsule biosynthesis protein CapA/YwtB (metallophosphatase superfamily)
MTGRGVDQILPHPGDPGLREPQVRDARVYVSLAEAVNGPIPSPVDMSWPWGDALEAIAAARPDLRLINLETAVTASDDFAEGKAVNYRMSPANVGCLTVARPDVCTLANNHVLDFGVRGLVQTLETLAANDIVPVGAGLNGWEAAQPARVRVGTGTRLTVFGLGTPSSGVPDSWAATPDRPGINFLPGLSEVDSAGAVNQIRLAKHANGIVVVSVHWGSNWGYQVPAEQIACAHRFVDAGADLVHGHSSHHARPVEIYRDRLILYGCGDLINDYEGIGGNERYRDDLRLLYFPRLRSTGELLGLTIVVLRARRLRLQHASRPDVAWQLMTLNRTSRAAHFHLSRHGALEWP